MIEYDKVQHVKSNNRYQFLFQVLQGTTQCETHKVNKNRNDENEFLESNQDNFKENIKKSHTVKKLYSCKYCGQKFKQINLKKDHETIVHENRNCEKEPFESKVRKLDFIMSNKNLTGFELTLSFHKCPKEITNPDGTQLYICNYCDSFNSLEKNDVLKHIAYSCQKEKAEQQARFETEEQARLAAEDQLRSEAEATAASKRLQLIQINSEQQPFVCESCDQDFDMSTSLKDHENSDAHKRKKAEFVAKGQ